MYQKNLKFLVIAMLLGIAFGTSYGQQNKLVDSLTQALITADTKAKTDILFSLYLIYSQSDYPRALEYAEQSYNLSYKLQDSLLIVKRGRVVANTLVNLGKNDEAIELYNKILEISIRNKITTQNKYILNSIALAYTYKGNYDKALEFNFRSLILREQENNQQEISISFTNIGLVYFRLKDYEQSLKYYIKALALKNTINDKYGLERLYFNTGLCYNRMKKYSDAIISFDKGFALCGKDCTEDYLKEGYGGLGAAFLETRKYQEAEVALNRALAIAEKQNDIRNKIQFLISLTDLYLKKGTDIHQALLYLNKAFELAGETDYSEFLGNIYGLYSKIYIAQSDYKKASEFQQKYIQVKDSLLGEDVIKNLARVQTNYEQRVNIKTIADKDAVLALKEETLKRQSAEQLFYIVVSVLVFVLAALMFMLFRLTQRANNLLEVRVEKRTKELNDSNEALAKVNGELDNFIYKTSHDIRGPLASLKGICNVAIMDVHDESALGYLQKLDFTAEKLNRILTRLLIINQINHAVLASNVIVFEELLEEILFLERKKGIPKRLKIFYEIEKGFVLKSDKEMLRIVLDNLIDNSIKFYNESDRVDPFVKIYIYSVEGQVVIKVIDNGVGISPEARERIFQMFVRASERSETGGIGLYLSRLATGRLEGKIEFRTTPEKYTEFSVRLPMDLAPILHARDEVERIRTFEISQTGPKQKKTVAS